ncbi:NRDE family protein [Zunongwangia endophytica]|uniref:NRDE family protein n=1 Tax=Zunongwangia endophytica TaxID=1808945 RepID=A0ABV8HB69_9FLAO|nr:NRDE family protein [Zunongwangia endophytica]MDN3596756.1 NRDE family protein [Zunongwangia endophytica]
MCTVSIFPENKNSLSFVLTFNRDEAFDRETFAPKFENVNRCEMIFPKDGVAGGTWLGVSAQKRLIGIMNGEFTAHKRNPPYRKSRGVVVKEFLAVEDVFDYADQYNFEGIEPFTMIIVEWSSSLIITELVWDAKKLHIKNVAHKPRIWSSSPLYDSGMKLKRENWFQKFITEEEITASTIWEFHHEAGSGDKNIDLIVDRGFLKTQSISQIIVNDDEKLFKYKELASGKTKIVNLDDLI